MKVLIIAAESARAKNNSEYLRVRYSGTDKIVRSAVMFSPFPDPEGFKGKVCEVAIHPGTPTDKIEGLSPLADSPDPFIRVTKIEALVAKGEMETLTRTVAGGIQVAPDLTAIVDFVLLKNERRWDKFSKHPAAVAAHHAYRGGLMEHTLGMLRCAKGIMEGDPAHQDLNRGVVFSSIVLHDVGKIATYTTDMVSHDYSVYQYLMGHIVIADEMITTACQKLGLSSIKGDVLHLRHCILAHHGKKEWGSPIVPATREAVLVHQIDMVQSRGQMALEGTEGLEPGKVSQQHKQLDAFLWKPL